MYMKLERKKNNLDVEKAIKRHWGWEPSSPLNSFRVVLGKWGSAEKKKCNDKKKKRYEEKCVLLIKRKKKKYDKSNMCLDVVQLDLRWRWCMDGRRRGKNRRWCRG
jgi:hypothetical protein